MTQTTEQILALAADTGAVAYSPPPFRAVKGYSFTYEELEDFYHAAIASYKAELLKEVGEPVGYLYDWIHSSATGRPDEKYTGFTEDKGFAIRDKHENCRDVFTSDQVAAAIAKAEQRITELIGELEHIREQKNLLWFEFSIATQQLAASQLRETQLRELIKRAHEFVRDDLCNDGLSSLMEALSLPTDTSALDAYVSEKVKEAMK